MTIYKIHKELSKIPAKKRTKIQQTKFKSVSKQIRTRKKDIKNCHHDVAKCRATPLWLNDEDKAKMRDFYKISKTLGDNFHVDHIIPIRGKLVCGLHIIENLSIVDKLENQTKGNEYESDWVFNSVLSELAIV